MPDDFLLVRVIPTKKWDGPSLPWNRRQRKRFLGPNQSWWGSEGIGLRTQEYKDHDYPSFFAWPEWEAFKKRCAMEEIRI